METQNSSRRSASHTCLCGKMCCRIFFGWMRICRSTLATTNLHSMHSPIAMGIEILKTQCVWLRHCLCAKFNFLTHSRVTGRRSVNYTVIQRIRLSRSDTINLELNSIESSFSKTSKKNVSNSLKPYINSMTISLHCNCLKLRSTPKMVWRHCPRATLHWHSTRIHQFLFVHMKHEIGPSANDRILCGWPTHVYDRRSFIDKMTSSAALNEMVALPSRLCDGRKEKRNEIQWTNPFLFEFRLSSSFFINF